MSEPERGRRATLIFLASLAALTLFRAWFNGAVPLSGEEAYYWAWSRHLDLCYFDHPPLIAWVIRLGTSIAGDTVFGVRAAALALHTAAALLVFHLTRRVFNDSVTAAWAGALFTTTVFFGATASAMIPDGPLFFCWALAVWLVVEAMRPGKQRLWLVAGAALGLCALAKFHAILLAAAIGLFLMLSPTQRKQFRSGWLYLGALVALLMTVPVFWWNARHGWATLGFQLAGRHSAILGSPWFVLEMAVAPFGYIGIVTYPLCVAGAVWGLRRKRDELFFLSLATLMPIGFFTVLSIFIRIDSQWAAPGYVAGVPLAAALGVQLKREGSRRRWRRALLPVGVGLGAAILLVARLCLLAIVAFPVLLPTESKPLFKRRGKLNLERLNPIYGWEEIGRRMRQEVDLLGGDERVFIMSPRSYGTTSSIYFYTAGHPPTFVIADPPAKALQYSIWERQADLVGKNAVVVSAKPKDLDPAWLEARFESYEKAAPIVVTRGGEVRRRLFLVRGRGYKGRP